MDDDYKPHLALKNTQALNEQKKVFALIGNVGTPTAEKVLPYVREKQFLLFGAFTGTNLLRQDPPDRYVFNYRASYEEETAKIVTYLIETRRVDPKRIAVFAQRDSYGDDAFAGVVRALRRYKVDEKTIFRVGYERGSEDVSDAVQKIVKREAVDAVVMVATYKPAAQFIHQVRQGGKRDIIFTNVSFVGDALRNQLEILAPGGSDGVIVTQVVPHPQSGATGVLKYREHLKTYFPGKEPSFNSLEGYIDAAILAEGLKRAGDNLTTETLIDALESIKGFELGIGTPITFSKDEHQGSRKVWGTIIKAGKLQNEDLD
jgi:ABC-type branched-subunit amino acid transport system substrate-binding protein